MSMPAKQQVFIETSIQIARVLAEPKQRDRIEQQLQRTEYEFVTSQYVFMEYQRSLIADFAYVQRAFRQAKTMGEAMRFVFTGARGFRTRSLVRCGQIASLVYGEREIVQLADVTALLDLYLQLLLRRIFWQRVSPLSDPIHCDLLNPGITQQPDQTYQVADSCRKESATCALPNFLTEQRIRLNRIADYLKAHPNVVKHQSRLAELLGVVQNSPKEALGQASCWPLGDVIIALQVPTDAAIWTLDRDFRALSAALGLRLYAPDEV